MKLKLSLLSLAFSSITIFVGQAFAAEPDPILTEKSQETFELDFDGLRLSLPVELKTRVLATAKGNPVTALHIGNVDIAYNRIDPKTSERKLVKGWIEVEALKHNCTVEKEMDTIRKLLLSDGEDTIKIQQISNEKFKGHLVDWIQTSHGQPDGVSVDLIDGRKSSCYIFNLAYQDFDGFSEKEIREAVSPITNAVKKSYLAYVNQ